MFKAIGNDMKHAYLIIAHKNDLTFQTLLRLLDDSNNDIYIHMDIKNRDYDSTAVLQYIKHANVYHTVRTNVTWGGYSQIRAELILLKTATSIDHYKYYHLISGEDLPIKSQEYIHSFLSESDCEYIGISHNQSQFLNRVNAYHFFQEKIGRLSKSHPVGLFFKTLDYISIRCQSIFKIKRNKNVDFAKGMNWFSITDSFARYVVDKEKWIKHTFRWTFCADEIFLQTLAVNSEYKDKICHPDENDSALRFIDWKRGNPYVFKEEDFDSLISSSAEMLFARKFSANTDCIIIKKIEQYLNG